ncbi:hypothetical protein IFM89_005105, partial [Coptis chinensis]
REKGYYPRDLQNLPTTHIPSKLEGDTALHVAARAGLSKIVKLLIFYILETYSSSAHGGPYGRTALHTAAIHNRLGIAKMLVDKKPCLIKEVDENGWSPLHCAAYYNFPKMSFCSDSWELLDNEGQNFLHDTMETHNMVDGDLFNEFDNDGNTFLHLVVITYKFECFFKLINNESMIDLTKML